MMMANNFQGDAYAVLGITEVGGRGRERSLMGRRAGCLFCLVSIAEAIWRTATEPAHARPSIPTLGLSACKKM